jgi:hypothetical protein
MQKTFLCRPGRLRGPAAPACIMAVVQTFLVNIYHVLFIFPASLGPVYSVSIDDHDVHTRTRALARPHWPTHSPAFQANSNQKH